MKTRQVKDRCVCGHSKEDHHISYFPGGGELVEECEKYGWNEHGGMKYIKKPGDTIDDYNPENWQNHCQRYQEKVGKKK